MKEKTEHMDIQDDLLISYLLGEASPAEIKQVENWRETDQACNQRFKEFTALWEASKNLDDDIETDTEAAFYRYKEKAANRKATKLRIIRMKTANTWLAVAASLCLVVGGAWLYFSILKIANINVITQTETRTASLPDGSVITLNRLSHFEYPSRFNGAQRRVKLDSGEAFFSVAHNKEKPFLITAGNTLIRVVGTSFNVKNKKGMVEVIVETGLVKVSSNNRDVLLKPGDKLVVKQGIAPLIKERNPDQLYTYYRSKKFIADDTPLWRMVEVLNEAYDCHIVVGRKELNNLPLNTTFEDASLDKVLDVISRTFKITVEKKHGDILLK